MPHRVQSSLAVVAMPDPQVAVPQKKNTLMSGGTQGHLSAVSIMERSTRSRVEPVVPEDVWELVFAQLPNAEQQRLSLLSKAHRCVYVNGRRRQMARPHRDIPLHHAIAFLNPSLPVVPADHIYFYDGLMAFHAEQTAQAMSERVDAMEEAESTTWPRRAQKPPSAALLEMRKNERESWTAVTKAWRIAISSAAIRQSETQEAADIAARCATIGPFYAKQARSAQDVADLHRQFHHIANTHIVPAQHKLDGMIARDKASLHTESPGRYESPAVVARRSRRNDAGMNLVLLSDKSLWFMNPSKHSALSQWSRIRTGVVKMTCNAQYASVLLEDGTAIVIFYRQEGQQYLSYASCNLPQAAFDVCFNTEDLLPLVLTAEGSIFLCGPPQDHWSAGPCTRLLASGDDQPKFALVSAAPVGGIVAVDCDGHLYTTGKDGRLHVTPDPPAPVRDVLMLGDGHALALLVDGRIWSVSRQCIQKGNAIVSLLQGSSWWDDDQYVS